MKILPILAAFSTASGPAFAAGDFTLVIEEKDGIQTLAVSEVKSGALAVAIGSDDLKIVDGAAAQTIVARLLLADACDAGFAGGENPDVKPRVVIHKMDYDEDPTHVGAERETRIAPRDRFETDGEISGLNRSGKNVAGETEDAALISGRGTNRMRITRITGANDAEASRFIDDAAGLDADEKAALKEALGL